MKIKYVGCFEQIEVNGRIVKNGETVDLPDEVASGVAQNPGQWEIVEGVEKASRKGVK